MPSQRSPKVDSRGSALLRRTIGQQKIFVESPGDFADDLRHVRFLISNRARSAEPIGCTTLADCSRGQREGQPLGRANAGRRATRGWSLLTTIARRHTEDARRSASLTEIGPRVIPSGRSSIASRDTGSELRICWFEMPIRRAQGARLRIDIGSGLGLDTIMVDAYADLRRGEYLSRRRLPEHWPVCREIRGDRTVGFWAGLVQLLGMTVAPFRPCGAF